MKNSTILILFMHKFRLNWKKSILILFLLIVFSSEINAKLPTTIIKSCYDGDTCTTIDGEKIRLACIDTPEIKGKKADPIPAKEARDFLNNLLSNKKVSIRRVTYDKYDPEAEEYPQPVCSPPPPYTESLPKPNAITSASLPPYALL